MAIRIAINMFGLLETINTILLIHDSSETPIGPCSPSRAEARTAYVIGVRPGQSHESWRPSRLKQRTDGLDAWEHWAESVSPLALGFLIQF